MLTIGVLFLGIGFVLTLFNTVSFRFVRDQEKDKKQLIAGVICILIGLGLTIQGIINLGEADI